MIKTDGAPTIAWAPIVGRDPGDETDHVVADHAPDIKLTRDELFLIAEALDSHAYWQLSDHVYRNDGYVRDPGSDDPELAEQIKQTRELEDRVRAALTESCPRVVQR